MRKSDHGYRAGLLRRTAKETRNYRVMIKILAAGMASIVALIAVVYVGAALYKNTGSFTISLNKQQMSKYGLSLSETEDMRYKTSHLNAGIDEDMTNIDGAALGDELDTWNEGYSYKGGAHNGEDYIAYTFYAQNMGQTEVSYRYSLAISNITNGLDEAIRVRLYVDGERTTYGMASKETGELQIYADEGFESSTCVVDKRIDGFKPGDKTKFTVVVWIEGNDPECLDPKIGGTVKLDMNIRIEEDSVKK